jgi:hypothetical protein
MADHISELPPRLQRALALLFIPAVFCIVWAGLIWPVSRVCHAQGTWRATAATLLARQRGLAEIEPTVREQLDALPRLTSWQRLYPAGEQGSAVLVLQSDISAALSAAQVRPQSFVPIEPSQSGGLRKVGLRVAAPMTIDQLRAFLGQAVLLPHFVRIEQLLVSSPSVQSAQENPILTVTLDIFGFVADAPR